MRLIIVFLLLLLSACKKDIIVQEDSTEVVNAIPPACKPGITVKQVKGLVIITGKICQPRKVAYGWTILTYYSGGQVYGHFLLIPPGQTFAIMVFRNINLLTSWKVIGEGEYID